MLWLIWSYLKKTTNKHKKYYVPTFLIFDSKCIQFTAVSICNKLKWKVVPTTLETQPEISPLKNVMSWQNWRILRSRTLGQLPSMCIFYSLSFCEHILHFMKDVKNSSIVSILHVYFILNFHHVTFILHTAHILIWRQIMNLLIESFNKMTSFIKSYCLWEILCSFCRCKTLQNRLKTKCSLCKMWFLVFCFLPPNESKVWLQKESVRENVLYPVVGLGNFKTQVP